MSRSKKKESGRALYTGVCHLNDRQRTMVIVSLFAHTMQKTNGSREFPRRRFDDAYVQRRPGPS
jgi:hypothetical protein